jgi:hypothetical protein
MANCSIPNSSPASGRISTRSLKRSRRQNRTAARYQALAPTKAITRWPSGFFNAERSTLNAQRSIQKIGRWTLDVGRWVFSATRRVKGAWWPSRSSKPSSSRKWRDRFDSYPLRHFISDLRFSIADWPPRISDDFNRKSQFENRKSGEGR